MRILKPLIIVAIICMVLGVLAELVMRIAFPVPMEPPGMLTLTNDIAGVKSSVTFQFDGDRLRKVNWIDKERSDGIRILCLGGNGTTALLQDAKDTWWGLLAANLGKTLGKPVETASLANVDEAKILPGVVAAEKVLKKYDVDLIVAVFGFSDAFANPGDYKFDPTKLQRLRNSEPIGLRYKLAKASHILRSIRNSRTARAQANHQAQLSRPNYYRDWLAARAQYLASRPMAERIVRTGDDPLEEYLSGIDSLAALAEEHGAKLLVVGEPTIYKSSLDPAEVARLTVLWHPVRPVEGQKDAGFRVRPLAVETELQRFYNAAQQKCESLGVGWFNLQGEILRYSDYFVTETYLTDKGSQAVCEKLLPPVAAALGYGGDGGLEESAK